MLPSKISINGELVMKSQTLIDILKITLFVAVSAALIIALCSLIPDPAFLATVSWNG
jgi:hypothetical protein